MSTLVDRPGRAPVPRSGPFADGRVQLAAGALAAVQAAVASLVMVLVPVVAVWATAAFSSAPWQQAVRAGTAAWLLAHHAGLQIPGGHVGLVPLGLTVVPLIACWLAGVRLGRTLDPNAEAVRAGVGRSRPAAPPMRAFAALVLTYAGLVTLAGVPVTNGAIRPVLWQAFAGAAVLCGLASAAGCAAWVAGGLRPGLRLLLREVVRRLRLPAPVRAGLAPAGLAVAVQLAGAVLLLVAALGLGRGEILSLHGELSPGPVGGLVLTLGQVAVLPDLVVWAASWASGPGFAVGAGTAVTPGHTVLGPLPALPVLGALPAPGPWPAWAWAVTALPVLAGVVAGHRLLRAADADRRPTDHLTGVGVVAGLTAVAWAGLAGLASGPAGPGRLAEMGPTAWQVGLATGLEVGLGALLAVGLAAAKEYGDAHLRRDPPPEPTGP